MLTVTLDKIYASRPCNKYWRVIKAAFAPTKLNIDFEKPIPATAILDKIGLDGFIKVFIEIEEFTEMLSEFACWCSLRNIHLIKRCVPERIYNETAKALQTNDIHQLNKRLIHQAYLSTRKSPRFSKSSRLLYSIYSIGLDTAASIKTASYAANDQTKEELEQFTKLYEILSS
ncbi:hypothetical protein [Vibrio ziniensis]|uniref:Uncharacterized protein n=1 Tax=Vibrio ziniensis TaxID=2711221 RepID=A0A6G7CN08_9VIBR|nr:hypothetical protein [Vibrio ziniensis]QIH43436.1 hypothetical protein G5S32_15680 [Vibrio ziniensis]